MPAFIHQRAEHLLAKNPSMKKETAFAIATQQGHALGKNPKGYGTKAGKKAAKSKYDKPKKEYTKTPNPGDLETPKLPRDKEKNASLGELLVDIDKAASSAPGDDPYLLDQIGKEPKVRPTRADAPDPKFRVKQASFWTALGGAGGAATGAHAAGEGSRVGGALAGGATGGLVSELGMRAGELIGQQAPDNPLVAVPAGLLQLLSPATGTLAGGVAGRAYKGAKKGVKEEFGSKEAMIPTSGMGAQKNIMDPAKRLAESQKIGVPKMEQPKVKPLNIKVAALPGATALKALSPSARRVMLGAGLGAAGGAAAGAAAGGEGGRLSGALKGSLLGVAGGAAAGWAGPRYMAGRAGGLTPRQAAGSLVEQVGVGTRELGRRVGGTTAAPARAVQKTSLQLPVDPRAMATGAASPMAMAKAAFAVSQYSGTLGPGRLTGYASHLPPFRNPMLSRSGSSNEELAMAQKEMRKQDKDFTPLPKLSAMRDELAKLNAVQSPEGQITRSQKVGAPKATAPPGPSIAQISKPVGYGRPMAGATKSIS